jgi:hypothetical protein
MVLRTVELDDNGVVGNDDVGIHWASARDQYSFVIVEDGTSDRLEFMGEPDLLLRCSPGTALGATTAIRLGPMSDARLPVAIGALPRCEERASRRKQRGSCRARRLSWHSSVEGRNGGEVSNRTFIVAVGLVLALIDTGMVALYKSEIPLLAFIAGLFFLAVGVIAIVARYPVRKIA